MKLHRDEDKSKIKLLEISLWIDNYGDLFSDFDPRPFSERTFSDDFITQIKKMSKDTKGPISTLKLLVPQGVQVEENDKIIRKRLSQYFYDLYQQIREEFRSVKLKGLYFSVVGIILMLVAAYISFLKLSNFLINLLLVLFEPAGWFFLWSGMDNLITFSKSKKDELSFYKRMSNVQVEFDSYV